MLLLCIDDMTPDRTPLSPGASDALTALCEPVEQADGLSRDAVVEQVQTADLSGVDPESVVNELLSKGYLYEVEGQLYVTPT